MNKILLAGLIIAIGIGGYMLAYRNVPEESVKGAGVPTYLQIATTTAVGPDEVITIFDEINTCKARVISTKGSAIMVTFGEPTNGDFASTTLTGMVGHWQSASTTVAYSSDDYGCGQWNAYSISSTTINTSEL